jgi:hypothetical protein
MPYCTLDDIKRAMLNVTITSTSKPSEDDIEGVAAVTGPPAVAAKPGYIDLITAEIDCVLEGVGITLPVTDATKLLLLARIAVDGVVAMALRAIGGVEPEQIASSQSLYDKALKAIRDNPDIISSIVASAGQAITGYESTAERHFHREEQEW